MDSEIKSSLHPIEQAGEATLVSATFPEISRKQVIAKVPSGEIRLEQGADGLWILFDCECIHALPWCQAQCCGLKGIGVLPDEQERLDKFLEWDNNLNMPVMVRDADSKCCALDRKTCTCTIYEQRPRTCRDFHCTWGADMRGWKLPNSVNHQARH